jgi:sigma-54 dependent transcriptional regulator, acetoin dehydrogenase operon transcriptional activator AcoR
MLSVRHHGRPMDTKTDTVQWTHEGRGEDAASLEPGLVLLHSPDFKELPAAVAIPDGGLVVGRAPGPGGLRVAHGAVSQLHARILRKEGGWALKDLGSRNGTLVNGRLQKEAALEPLDLLRFGDATFKFVLGDVAEYARYRIDGEGPARDPDVVGGFQVRRALAEIAHIATTPLSVLVRGETGTGKELFARAVHRLSGRRGPLVALNCAAIPANLVESELFGWKRGAFTGAERDKAGLVRAADKGTLFLDEIGDMPLEAQTKLLRVTETREVLPVGATSGEGVDVRFVCATHHDLESLVDAGRFRGDLLARLHGAVIRLPPLRERKEDVFALVTSFLARAGAGEAKLRPSFMAGLLQWDWPYNVRELEAAVRRAVAVARGAELTVDHLPDAVREAMRDYGTVGSLPSAAAGARAAAPAPDELRALLARHDGNVAAVARELGRDRAQIHRWMRYAGIDPATYRGS